jgi:hypothetical protein
MCRRLAHAGVVIGDGDLVRLLHLDEPGRKDWLDDNEPARQDVNWWLHVLLVIDQRVDDQRGEPADWAKLRVWLLRQGRHRAVFTEVEYAEQLAYFVAAIRHAGIDTTALPSADDLVEMCLDAIPVRLNEVAVVADPQELHRLDLTSMRHSRQAKNLVKAAAAHLDAVRDERVAARLRAWIDLQPRLV